jgi:O-antigen biosynthesis protein
MTVAHPPLPPCSVVIPSDGRRGTLDATLGAVLAQDPPPAEVLVVGSGAAASVAAEAAHRHGAAFVAEPRPGASRARNRGAAAVEGEVVAFTDDDAVPQPGWLAALSAAFADPAVAAAGGRVRGADAPSDEASALAAWVGLSHAGGAEGRVVDRDTPGWFEIAHFGGIGIGPNMAFRRSALLEAGGFDERLGPGTPLAGGEEPYAFFTLLERGHRAVYVPEALVLHPCPMPPLDELRRRQRHAYASATGYAAFLLLVEPRWRWTVLRYVAEGAAGKRRAWRGYTAPALAAVPPGPGQRVREYLRGIALGARCARAERGPASTGE